MGDAGALQPAQQQQGRRGTERGWPGSAAAAATAATGGGQAQRTDAGQSGGRTSRAQGGSAR